MPRLTLRGRLVLFVAVLLVAALLGFLWPYVVVPV